MLVPARKDQARRLELPGRVWSLLLGPDNSPTRNMSLGFASFPPGSAPEGHVHPVEEEIVYIVSGRGTLTSPDGSVELEPGTAVFIPVGVHHATAAGPDEPLEMVTVFSPPVIPGSYEPDGRGGPSEQHGS
jgi:quercetin dioxygenase-like cupin family protein